MAETKTNTTRGRKKVVEDEIVNDIDLQKELEKSNAEKTEMANMLKMLQEQIEQMKLNMNNNTNGSVVIKQNDDITRVVKVISLLPNRYDLPTQPNGKGGKIYTFTKYGDVQNIRFTDMIDILTRFTHQFEKGYAVLTNQKDYDDLGIGYIWDSVLSLDKTERLIKLQDENSVDTIIDMEKDMQEKIVGIIARKIVDGYSYDYNKIKQLEDNGLAINETVELLSASTDK